MQSQRLAPLVVPPPFPGRAPRFARAGTKSGHAQPPPRPGRRPRGGPARPPAPGFRAPGREAEPGPSGPRGCRPQLRLPRGGVWRGARAGGPGRDPDVAQVLREAEDRGDHCEHRMSGRLGRPPRVPICRAEKLGGAVGARSPRKGRPAPFGGAFGVLCSRQVLCLRGDCQARPPGFASSSSQPLPPPLNSLSLLFGWVITGSSCRGGRGAQPRFCVFRPSRVPPTPPGPRPLPTRWRHFVAVARCV